MLIKTIPGKKYIISCWIEISCRFHRWLWGYLTHYIRRLAIFITNANTELVYPWWRHQMEAFSALLAIFAGNSPVPGEFPAQKPVTRSFEVFFDLRLNKRLSKQSWGWWFETLSRPLWRRCKADTAMCHWVYKNFNQIAIVKNVFSNKG